MSHTVAAWAVGFGVAAFGSGAVTPATGAEPGQGQSRPNAHTEETSVREPASVQDGGRVFIATAQTITGAERERVWEERVADAPRYAHYQERTDRRIPLVRLS